MDTQACASVGLDENRTDDMTLLIEGCKQLATRKDCFVLLVHHAGKDLTRGARGSSTQLPSWDCCIEATRNGQRREWKAVKVKDGGGEGEKHPFRLAVVDLGADEDADRVTSCVALPDGEAVQDEKPLPPALSYGLESLKSVLKAEGRESVHLETWRPVFYAGHTAENPNAKKKAFERARKDLVSKGVIIVSADNYSVNNQEGQGQGGTNGGHCPLSRSGQDGTPLYNRVSHVPVCPPTVGVSHE